MSRERRCRVTVRDVEGIVHHVHVQGSTLFEAAAAALAVFRDQEWAVEALTRSAVLRVEVHAPPVVHDVPLQAVERWLRSPAGSPKDRLVKRRLGGQG